MAYAIFHCAFLPVPILISTFIIPKPGASNRPPALTHGRLVAELYQES